MEIKIMGLGCKNCEKLHSAVKEVVEEGGFDAHIEKVEDMNEIAKTGIVMTPGLVVNGEVKASGSVPSKGKIKDILSSS